MDPDVALESMRALTKNLQERLDARDYEFDNWPVPEIEELLETFRGLDEWLSNGGFFPGAWKNTKRHGVS